jgi:hypothetical protein
MNENNYFSYPSFIHIRIENFFQSFVLAITENLLI